MDDVGSRPTSSYGRVDPELLNPSTGLPDVPAEVDRNTELTALFDRLSIFDDPDLVLEASAHVEALTLDARGVVPPTLETIVACMASNPTNLPLQQVGCSALANLAEMHVEAIVAVE
eukprot:Sspe_Gene.44423::Locus_21785_Transcript_1_1_Confidence_1.000_Length_3022::g.44423::m.44423